MGSTTLNCSCPRIMVPKLGSLIQLSCMLIIEYPYDNLGFLLSDSLQILCVQGLRIRNDMDFRTDTKYLHST